MSFADVLFPRICPVCEKIVRKKYLTDSDSVSMMPGMGFEKLICPHCYNKLPRISLPVCLKCGGHTYDAGQEYCEACRKTSRSFEKNLALMDYSNPVADRIIWNFKYNNKREYGDFLALEIARCFGKEIISWDCEAIVPVPVHPARKRARGYNQTEVLSKKLGSILEIKTDAKALLRIKKTLPQKKLGAEGRYQNLKAAFLPGKTASLYKRVILVDDIYTTGATLEVCTQALKSAGVEKVYCITCCVGQNGG